MKLSFLNVLRVAVIMLVCTLCSSIYAANTPAPKAKPTPPMKPKPETIASVSADSITVSHTKIKMGAKPGAGATEVTVSKTYKITPRTTVTIDGQTAKVSDLQQGMGVSLSAEADSDPKADKSSGGIATAIAAHKPPAGKK